MARTVFCRKLQKEADGLDFQLYPGELGKRIFETFLKKHGLNGKRNRPC